jgi:hypothetical protein
MAQTGIRTIPELSMSLRLGYVQFQNYQWCGIPSQSINETCTLKENYKQIPQIAIYITIEKEFERTQVSSYEI